MGMWTAACAACRLGTPAQLQIDAVHARRHLHSPRLPVAAGCTPADAAAAAPASRLEAAAAAATCLRPATCSCSSGMLLPPAGRGTRASSTRMRGMAGALAGGAGCFLAMAAHSVGRARNGLRGGPARGAPASGQMPQPVRRRLKGAAQALAPLAPSAGKPDCMVAAASMSMPCAHLLRPAAKSPHAATARTGSRACATRRRSSPRKGAPAQAACAFSVRHCNSRGPKADADSWQLAASQQQGQLTAGGVSRLPAMAPGLDGPAVDEQKVPGSLR